MLTDLYYTHTKDKDDALIFYTQMVPKTDENYRSKFLNVFLGVINYLRT